MRRCCPASIDPVFRCVWRLSEGDETSTAGAVPGCADHLLPEGPHIFGDLKIEIFDQDGKLVDTVAGGKHRGLNRAGWECE